MKKVLIVVILLLLPTLADARTIFLDKHATGCHEDGSATNTYDPATRTCGSGSDTVYAGEGARGGGYPYEASQALSSGDHLYIREGEYWRTITTYGYRTDGAVHIAEGQDNITIENYNGELVWLQSGDDHTDVVCSDTTKDPGDPVLDCDDPVGPISIFGDNITVQGNNFNFKIWGDFWIGGSDNLVTGMDLSGGWNHGNPLVPTRDAWANVVSFKDSFNAILRNCKIHDNYDIISAANGMNKALIMHDHDDNTIIENCEFYNPLTSWAYLKYQNGWHVAEFTGSGTHATYRYNFFHDGPNAIIELGSGMPPANKAQKEIFYQNIFVNAGTSFHKSFAAYSADPETYQIYNNVFYNPDSSVPSAIGLSSSEETNDRYGFFNNIVIGGYGYIVLQGMTTPMSDVQSYFDYNDYLPGNVNPYFKYTNWSGSTHDLSTWQSVSNKDAHSVTSDPGFSPDDGKVDGSDPSDFKRSSYPTNGRNGGVMGAYITGNETIGLLSPSRPPAPKNLRGTAH